MECFHRTGSTMRRLMLAVLVLLSMRVGLAESVSSLPKPNDYVNDYAHVLSPDAIAQLDRICAELDHSQANAQMAVVTVHNLDGDDAADWANQLEDKWKMGKKGRTGACWCCWRWTTTSTASTWDMALKEF